MTAPPYSCLTNTTATQRAKLVRQHFPDYDRDSYCRGWKAADFTFFHADTLWQLKECIDAAKGRGEPRAWFDGFSDSMIGRVKYESALCHVEGYHSAVAR